MSDDRAARAQELARKLIEEIPFCPWKPNPKLDLDTRAVIGMGPQQLFLLDFGKEALYGGAAGGGKLLDLDTLIPTPDGFAKLADVVPGDQILGANGQIYSVQTQSDIQFVDGWEFTFDDGSTVVSNDEHLWLTYSAKELEALSRRDPAFRERRRASRPRRGTGKRPDLVERNSSAERSVLPPPTGTVRTTAEIVDTLKVGNRSNHAIPVAEPIDLPERQLPLDPYVLGMWLGDGSSYGGQFTTADPELARAYSDAGFEAHRVSNQPYLYGTYGLTTILRRMNLLHNKHVPSDYLWASVGQRLALLQGLLDTDGNISGSGGVEFTNTNQSLAEAVAHLARSLGHKVTVREGLAKLDGRIIGPKWVVKFQPHMPVFRIERKAERLKLSTRRTTKFRYIIEAARVEARPMKCLRVSAPDSLFLCTEHFIPTHNSIALLMAASQFLLVPGYASLLLRKSYADLTKPGALMDIASQWWGGRKDIKFDTQESTYIFQVPGGGYSKVVFGYLDKANDKFKYQGGAYQFVGFDEITQHKQSDYEYLFSRMRKTGDPDNPLSRVPLRMRSTANPGGVGHKWVYDKFIGPWQKWKDGKTPRPKRNFYPAILSDNPKLDQASYIESLQELDPVTRGQLLHGDWNIKPDGRMFKRAWFKPITISEVPPDCAWIRYWDMASTEEDPAKEREHGGPDFTVGALVGRHPDGRWFIADLRRWRQNPEMNDRLLRVTALHDTGRVPQIMEEEPGSSGKTAIHHFRSQVFIGMNFRGLPSSGSKVVRAGPVASLADAGRVYIVTDGSWDIEAFLDELELFPDPRVHDDQVDAVSGGFGVLAKQFMGKLNLGAQLNDEFVRRNPWRPDVTLRLSPADLAAGSGLLNEKMASARIHEANMRLSVARAWAV